MIDSVKLYLPGKASLFPELATDIIMHTSKDGSVRESGMLDTFRLGTWNDGLVITGSLPRWVYGNNFVRMTRRGIEDAFARLSDRAGTDTGTASVWTLEFGACLVMKHPVPAYLACLTSLQRYVRDCFASGTVLFRQKSKSFQFYDKTSEAQSHRNAIPEIFNGEHVLKLELKLKNRIKTFLGRELTAAQLWEEETYISLVRLWYNTYASIQRTRLPRLDNVEGMKPNDLLRSLAACGVASLGPETVLSRIAEARPALSRCDHYRMKQLVRNLMRHPALTDTNPLMDELDSKVRQTVLYYR